MPSYFFRYGCSRPSGEDAEADLLSDEPLRATGGAFAPPADVFETSGGYLIRLEVAGVDPEQMDITTGEDDRTVTIVGRRMPAPAESTMRCLNLEVQYGAFARRFRLPADVDASRASARYEAGFLVVELPRLHTQVIRRNVQVRREGGSESGQAPV